MRRRQTFSRRIVVTVVPVLALTVLLSSGLGGTPVSTPSAGPLVALDRLATNAGAAFDSFNDAFYVETHGVGRYRATTTGGKIGFWKAAETLELVEDAYQRSGNPIYKHMIGALYKGFVARFGSNWMGDRYNDDIMWMVIACLRAYEITLDPLYRTQAKRHFDRVYARAWSSDFGGGLWWSTARREKNTCVNAPAAIAAAKLYRYFRDASYLIKAQRLYGWVRDHLFDPVTGSVYDHAYRGESGRLYEVAATDASTHTYSQGTFAGAAAILCGATHDADYLADGRAALDYAVDNLTTGGVLKSEGSGGDGGGFKGVFARWAVLFKKTAHLASYDAWLGQNEDAAWSHRDSRNLVGEDWSSQTGDGRLFAFDCSSAVVLMQVFTPSAAQ